MTRYQTGVARARNVRVRIQGGLRRRAGTRHLLSLTDGTDGIRMPSFAFNVQQTYCVILTPGKWKVLNKLGALIAQGTGAPWTTAQMGRLSWTQSADTLLLFHEDLEPRRLRRGVVETSWSLSTLPLQNVPSFDYGAVDPGSITVTPSATSGTITLTASAAIFTASMVGWQFIGGEGRARITGYTSSTIVTAEVLADFRAGSGSATVAEEDPTTKPRKRQQAATTLVSTDPITTWSIEEPVISSDRGWPSCGAFHQGRLWLGGFRERPASMIASNVGNYFDFDQGRGLDDQAIFVTIDGRQINAIQDLVSGRVLQIFTTGAEYADISSPPTTPTSIALQMQTGYGTATGVRSTDLDGGTLFVQAGGDALRQFVFADLEQAWSSELISLLSAHVLADPVQVEAMTGNGADGSMALITNGDGTVAVMTMARDQQIVAFSVWETEGQVLGTCCLRSGETFLAVLRDGTVRIEMLDDDALLDASTVVESETAFTAVANLFHLAGLEVGLILDGIWEGTATVAASGTVQLPRAANRAEVGLVFVPEIETLPLEPRDPTGNLIGRRLRLVQTALRVDETGPFEVQGNQVGLWTVGSGAGSPLDAPPPVQTGDVLVRGLAGWQARFAVSIRQPIPGPFELLAMSHKIQIGGL